MSDTTTTEEVQWGVEPRDLDSFKAAQERLAKARQLADIIPAEITDEATAGEAADALKELRFGREDLEVARKGAKTPYIEYERQLDAAFKELGSTNAAAEQSLKARYADYQAAVQKAADDERKRIEKNERDRQRRENERAAKEQRASRRVAPTPPPPPPPTAARGDNAQLVTRTVRNYEIRDEAALPDEYCDRVPNRKKVNAGVKAGLVIPGVYVWEKKETVAR
jgi:hypothetical protein